MTQIRLGIVGSGIAARELHLPALKKLKREFAIVAVCSRRRGKARAFAALAGKQVEVEPSLEALLERDDIDAIDVATPIMLNAPTATAALQAGKHVFMEKPVCVSVSQGRALEAVAGRSGLVAMNGENMRYRAVITRASELLEQRRIGTLQSFAWILQYQLTPSNKYAQTRWRQRHAYEGGFIFDGGVHNIAVIRSLAGEVTEVNARTVSINKQLGRIDGAFVEMQMESGVRGLLSIQLSAPSTMVDNLTLVGSRGIMTLTGDTLLISTGGRATRRATFRDGLGFQAEFKDFHRAVTRGEKPRSTLAEGIADVAVALAAFRSARRGAPEAV